MSEIDEFIENGSVRPWYSLLWDVVGCRVGVRLNVALSPRLGMQLITLKPLVVSEGHWASEAVRGHREVLCGFVTVPVPFSGDSVFYSGFGHELWK